MGRVLVLFFHPALERSRVHRALIDAPKRAGATVRDLYELYPDLDVDVRAEQDALLAHDALVLQHPMHWYSVPPLLRQWQDLVLEPGWAFGPGGRALAGKSVLHALSTGGPEQNYQPSGPLGVGLDELLRPLELSARLCGLEWLPPFAVHDAHRLAEQDLERWAEGYRRLLEALAAETLVAESGYPAYREVA